MNECLCLQRDVGLLLSTVKNIVFISHFVCNDFVGVLVLNRKSSGIF